MNRTTSLTLAVMVTTYNRSADLARTMEKIVELQPRPDEILITADGCTDDTVARVRADLPAARLLVNVERQRLVVSSDRMLRAANTDLVLSLDDDNYPEQSDCICRLQRLFQTIPGIAIAHFPQHTDEYPETLLQEDFGEACLTGSYANSGACYRRSAYLRLPGFAHRFFHCYEEPDYALQCIASGYLVVYWPKIIIRHHYFKVERDEVRTHHRHARNEFLSALMRCPMPLLLLIIPFRILSQLRYAFTRGTNWVLREPLWWHNMLPDIRPVLLLRRPVSLKNYIRWLRLLRKPLPLSPAE